MARARDVLCRLGKIISRILLVIGGMVSGVLTFALGLPLLVSFFAALVPVGGLTFALCLAGLAIISALLLPLLLVLYFTTHLVQLIRNRDESGEVAQIRGELASWIVMCLIYITISLVICLLIFRYSPSLKDRNFHDLAIWKWMVALLIICLFSGCTMIVRCMMGLLGPAIFNCSGDAVHFGEGIAGLINCGLFLLAEFVVIRFAPVWKRPTILGHQAWLWVRVILLVLLGHNAICSITSLVVMLLKAGCKDGSKDPSSTPTTSGSGTDGKEEEPFLEFIVSRGKKILRYIWGYLVPARIRSGAWKKYVVYFARGLRRSMNLLLTSLLFLLTWILYFGSRLDRRSQATKEVYDYVRWTLVCVLVISIFWLVKNAIVLSLAAGVIYNRFHDNILNRSTKLWLLGTLGSSESQILNTNWKKNRYDEELNEDQSTADQKNVEIQARQEKINEVEVEDPQHTICIIEDGKREDRQNNYSEGDSVESVDPVPSTRYVNQTLKDTSGRPRIRRSGIFVPEARKILVHKYDNPKDVPTHVVMQLAAYFLKAEDSLSKRSYISGILEQLEHQPHHDTNIDQNASTMDLPHGVIKKEDEILLRKEMQNKSFEFWIKRAHETCLDLARSLSGAKEVVDSLNQIIGWLLIGVMFVIWFLLTGIATSKVIVLIASPIVTASIIFGDTAKTFFQGIMFIYVLHPFDVGDICTIGDKTQMVVKRIGIWKTTFSKIGSLAEVLYPNSVLATVAIVNHRGDLHPDDYVELSLDSSLLNADEIDNLKQEINRYLQQSNTKRRPPGVIVKELGDGAMLEVHFKHDETKFSDMLSTEALGCKARMRDKLLLFIKNYLENKKNRGQHADSTI